MSELHNNQLRLATVGLGNWAGRVVDLLLKQRAAGAGLINLVSVFEPELGHHSRRVDALQALGIRVVDQFDQILNDPHVDAVILPVPIHLHRPLTERALLAGKAVLVEKPVAGCVQDVDAMISARDRAKRPVLVSFQDTYDPKMLELKRAILQGAIGEVQSITLVGCWPRDEAYYRRTTWAGHIQHEGCWVLDSPVTNAFAHYLHLAFFLLGDRESSWAQPTSVEAELYRAYDIENYDTASHRFIAAGVPVLVLLTHACKQSIGPHICVTGKRGTIQIDLHERFARITNERGSEVLRLSPDSRVDALDAFAKHVQNQPVDCALSTLEAARVHVVATNGASQAAIVRQVPTSDVVPGVSPDGEPCRFIPGIEQAMLQCGERGQTLHESGLMNWTVPGGTLSLLGYSEFRGVPTSSTFVKNIAHRNHRTTRVDETGVGSDA